MLNLAFLFLGLLAVVIFWVLLLLTYPTLALCLGVVVAGAYAFVEGVTRRK